MTRSRPPDWDARLAAAVELAARRSFSWGSFDCCLWACDVVALMRGVDLAAPFRGRYSDARGAARVLRDYAGRGIEEVAVRIAAAGGFQRIAPQLAQRGDVALISRGGVDALGVVMLGCVLAPAVGGGLARVPLADARMVWAV